DPCCDSTHPQGHREQDPETEDGEEHKQKTDKIGDVPRVAAYCEAPDESDDDPQHEKRPTAHLDQPRLQRVGGLDLPAASVTRTAGQLKIDKWRRRPRVDERYAVRVRIGPKNPRLAEAALVNREKEFWSRLGDGDVRGSGIGALALRPVVGRATFLTAT